MAETGSLIPVHKHDNKEVLDKLSQAEDGTLLFDGEEIKGGGSSSEPGSSDITISQQEGNAIQNKEDGIFVEDRSEDIDAIETKINQINKYQKYVNTELDYCICYGDDEANPIRGSVNNFLSYCNRIETSLEYNDEHYIKLKAHKRYMIMANCAIVSYSEADATLEIVDINGNRYGNVGWKKPSSIVDGIGCAACLCFEQDTYIGVKLGLPTSNDDVSTYNAHFYFIAQEISRQITIDPVEHINTENGIEDTPVGHILTHMGNNAPKHYLVCDGTEYNISDYPYLAEHILNEFGSYNYFGGDGTTTFAVPDLRGEFLRGTGTAIRNTGSGGEVGEHQDGTSIPAMFAYNGSFFGIYATNRTANVFNTQAANYDTAKSRAYYYQVNASAMAQTGYADYTIRPTNTSVLYCIKYEPTYYMNVSILEETQQQISLLQEQNTLLTQQVELLQQEVDQLGIMLDEINGVVI